MQELFRVGKTFEERLFRIPDYQRSYAWTERQVRDFVEDLELLAPDKQHFMGTLILHERSDVAPIVDEQGQSHRTYDVVDGQQRLTTIVLFLDAIRREMIALGDLDKLVDKLFETYIAIDRWTGGPSVPKLTLNADTHSFFYNVILTRQGIQEPTIRSHELLSAAQAFFAEYLADKRDELGDAYLEWLKSTYLKVTGSLTMLVYAIQNEADAGVVFETMNNRGQALTDLERTKNYLLYLASKLDLPSDHGLVQEINGVWSYIFRRLMAFGLGNLGNEDQLLRAHWLMAYDDNVKRWQRTRSIQAHFSLRRYQGRHPDLLADLTEYLTSLKNAATAYCDVFSPWHPNAFGAYAHDGELRARIVAAATRFARLGAQATLLPLLMAVRIRAPQDGRAYLHAIELCERFVFRVYRWAGKRANTGRSWVFRLGYDLYHGHKVSSTLNELCEAILYYCPDDHFEARFKRDEDWYHWWGIKYMLYEYEQYLAREQGQDVRMPWETLSRKADTIEHVLPQTLDAGGYWAERLSPQEHARYVHDIGNLTLTYDNSVLGNKPFPEKRGTACQPNCYASSKLFIEQQLARYDDWTKAEILERREQIRQWAVQRWRVEQPERLPSPLAPPEKTAAISESPEQRLLRLASQQGNEESLCSILECVRRYPDYLYPRMHKYWWVLKVTPLRNKSRTLFWVGVDLWCKFVLEDVEQFLHIPADEARDILGGMHDSVLQRDQVPEFIGRLKHLIERAQEIAEREHPASLPDTAAGIDLEDKEPDARTGGIEQVLTRIFIPYGQLTLYSTLYQAGADWVSTRQLAEQIRGGDTVSLRGVLAALSKRINDTKPFEAERPGLHLFFEVEARDGETCYRMRPELREAIESLPGLHEVVNRSVEKILDKYKQDWWPNHATQREQLGLDKET